MHVYIYICEHCMHIIYVYICEDQSQGCDNKQYLVIIMLHISNHIMQFIEYEVKSRETLAPAKKSLKLKNLKTD